MDLIMVFRVTGQVKNLVGKRKEEGCGFPLRVTVQNDLGRHPVLEVKNLVRKGDGFPFYSKLQTNRPGRQSMTGKVMHLQFTQLQTGQMNNLVGKRKEERYGLPFLEPVSEIWKLVRKKEEFLFYLEI